MPIEYQISLEDAPGSLAWLGATLGDADVNIEAIVGRSGRGASVVHFVPDKPMETALALEDAGIPYSTRDVVLVNVLDKPGVLGEVALVMAEADVNIDCIYVTVKGLVVLGVNDLEGATQVACGMAVAAE